MNRVPLACGALVAIAAALVYWPAFPGAFYLDDHANIVGNPALQNAALSWEGLTQAVNAFQGGVLHRPLTMLSFWLQIGSGAQHPDAFLAVNVLLHAINAVLVFLLMRALLGILGASPAGSRLDRLAMFGALVWAVHPLYLTSVAYIYQRATLMAGMAVFGGLNLYLAGRRREAASPGFGSVVIGLSGAFVLPALGGLAKENSALGPFLCLVVELLIIGRALGTNSALRRWLLGLCVAFAAVIVGYFAWNPAELTLAYKRREFTLPERVMTQARILWSYLTWFLLPRPSALGLHHDDIAISHGLMDPPATAAAIFAWILSIAASALACRRWWTARIALAGILFFLVAHAAESSVLSLELAFEHRNYVPLFGVALGVTWVCWRLTQLTHGSPGLSAVVGILMVAAPVTLAGQTVFLGMKWSKPADYLEYQARNHPGSARAQSGAAIALLTTLPPSSRPGPACKLATRRLINALEIEPHNMSAHLATIDLGIRCDSLDVASSLADLKSAAARTKRKQMRALASLSTLMALPIFSEPTRTQALEVFDAAIGNTITGRRGAAQYLAQKSMYQANTLGDWRNAYFTALEAIAHDPRYAGSYLTAAEIALAAGEVQAARELLTDAASLPTLSRFKHVYQDALARLHAREQGAAHGGQLAR